MKGELGMAKDALMAYLQAGETTVSNLLLHHYREIGMSSGELLVYLELKSYIDRGIDNPSVSLLADHLQTSERTVYDLIHQLTEKGLLVQSMKPDQHGKETAYYDFSPLFNRLMGKENQLISQHQAKQQKNAREQLFAEFEGEFGRPLSAIEISYVNDWIDKDHYDIEMIRLALREAVINGALRFRYLDSVLLNWRKNNLKTPQAVEQNKREFEAKRAVAKPTKPKSQLPKIPIFKIEAD